MEGFGSGPVSSIGGSPFGLFPGEAGYSGSGMDMPTPGGGFGGSVIGFDSISNTPTNVQKYERTLESLNLTPGVHQIMSMEYDPHNDVTYYSYEHLGTGDYTNDIYGLNDYVISAADGDIFGIGYEGFDGFAAQDFYSPTVDVYNHQMNIEEGQQFWSMQSNLDSFQQNVLETIEKRVSVENGTFTLGDVVFKTPDGQYAGVYLGGN
jgi:hypothetical protein